MAEQWQCFEQKIVEIGENLVNAVLDSGASLKDIRQEIHSLTLEVHAVAVEVSRIASIQEKMHRPQQIGWSVGTPTNEG